MHLVVEPCRATQSLCSGAYCRKQQADYRKFDEGTFLSLMSVLCSICLESGNLPEYDAYLSTSKVPLRGGNGADQTK